MIYIRSLGRNDFNMTQPAKKKVWENSPNYVENILNQRVSRRQALGRGAAIAIGVGVVVVGAAGYLAYQSSQGGPTTSTTTSSSASTTPTSSSTTSLTTSPT